jgi:hypothetical protein
MGKALVLLLDMIVGHKRLSLGLLTSLCIVVVGHL